MTAGALRMSVVIPTYLRPDWIGRAVRSLVRQTTLPVEVLPVARDADLPTHRAVEALQAEGLPFDLRMLTVTEPGFMPPVARGLSEARCDVIAVMDDDAEALETWAEGILRHYDDPAVGAVGGRCINMSGNEEIDVPETDRIAYISRWGRIIGDMYKKPRFSDPVDAAFMMGGCASMRRTVAADIEFDYELNRGVAFGYEVDVGLQIRNLGWRVVFDPAVAIRHYSAPRAVEGMRRRDNVEAVHWATHNETRVALRRLPPTTAATVVARGLLIGTRRAPGLLPWVSGPLGGRLGFQQGVGRAAVGGRVSAVYGLLRDGRPMRRRDA